VTAITWSCPSGVPVATCANRIQYCDTTDQCFDGVQFCSFRPSSSNPVVCLIFVPAATYNPQCSSKYTGHKMSSIGTELGGSITYAPNDWLPALFSLHGIDTESANRYLDQSPYYMGGHWDIPDADDTDTPPVLGLNDPEDTWKYQNDRIQHRFMDIMNDIIHHFCLGDSRKVLTTESTDDEMDDVNFNYNKLRRDPKFSTRPDLAILGQDTRYLPRPLDSYESRMSIEEGDRIELYRGCVAIGKVERYQRRGWTDRMLEKVATCAK